MYSVTATTILSPFRPLIVDTIENVRGHFM